MRALPRNDIEEFDRRWRRVLMSFFSRRIGDRAEAEDLTQEVFERMLRHDSGGGHSEARPDAFVFQIAVNLLADRHRRYRVRERYRHFVEAEERRDVEFVDPHAIASGRQGMEQLLRALETLPERTRTMFVLYKFEQLGQDTIAERYGISKSAVKQQIAKAMALLASRLGDMK